MTIKDIYCFCRKPKEIKDFWKVNSDISYLEPFNQFKKKKNSAKIMYAIWLLYDPKSQIQNSGGESEKVIKEISKNFLGDENFDWSDYRDVISAYKSYSQSKIEKNLAQWYSELNERLAYAKELEWEGDSATVKDNFLKTQDEYFKKYFEIEAMLKEEREERLMHGNYTPSMLEARYL